MVRYGSDRDQTRPEPRQWLRIRADHRTQEGWNLGHHLNSTLMAAGDMVLIHNREVHPLSVLVKNEIRRDNGCDIFADHKALD